MVCGDPHSGDILLGAERPDLTLRGKEHYIRVCRYCESWIRSKEDPQATVKEYMRAPKRAKKGVQ